MKNLIVVILAPFIITWFAQDKYYRVTSLNPLTLVDNYNDEDTIVIGDSYGIVERDKQLCNIFIGAAVQVNETDTTYNITFMSDRLSCHYELEKINGKE